MRYSEYRKHKNRRMTIDRDEKIFELAKKGYTYRAIAKEVGCVENTVAKVIRDALYLRDYSAWELKELKDEQLAALQVELVKAAYGGDSINLPAVDRLLKTMELRMKMRGLLQPDMVVNNNNLVLPEGMTPQQIIELAKMPLLSERATVEGEVVSAGGEQSYDPPGD